MEKCFYQYLYYNKSFNIVWEISYTHDKQISSFDIN